MDKASNQLSRRKFIKNTAFTAASFFILPRYILGGSGYTAPSDRMYIAAIGVGGKGYSDIVNASMKGREYVVALCDIDPYGKHRVIDTRKAFPKANFYTDFREMLDKEKSLDAITISTPDHTHTIAAMEAMKKGIHVYIQKPLTHNIKEARMLTEAARKYKIVTQMGNQGASTPEIKKMQEWVDNDLIGKVSKVYCWTDRPVWPQGIPFPEPSKNPIPKQLNWDAWLGPAKNIPYTENLHPFNWRGWWEYGTGALGDMGCHLIDIPYRALQLGYPKTVECSMGSVYTKMWVPDYFPESCPPSSYVTLNFDDATKTKDLQMIWSDGGIRPPKHELIPGEEDMGEKGGGNGVIMIGEKGIITCGTYGLTPRLYRKNEKTLSFTPTKEDKELIAKPEYGHQENWIDACKEGFGGSKHKALTSSFDYAGPLTETILMGNLAIRSYMLRRKTLTKKYDYYGRKKLLWDGEKMKITNLKEANLFVSRKYRKGWEL